MPWRHQKPTKTNSSGQVEIKHTSTGAHNHGKLLENFYPTFIILAKTFSEVTIGIVENQLAAMLNTKRPEKKVSLACFWLQWSPKNWTNGKSGMQMIFWIQDEDLGVFHEVSLISIPPTFTNQSESYSSCLQPVTVSKLRRLGSDKLPNIL